MGSGSPIPALRCQVCGSLEHHRVARTAVDSLPRRFVDATRCLLLSAEQDSVASQRADAFPFQQRLAAGSTLEFPGNSFEWVYVEPVLAENDLRQELLAEALRLVGSGYVMVGAAALNAQQSYGLQASLPAASVLELVALDRCTLKLQSLFVLSQDASGLLQIAGAIAQANMHARIFPAKNSGASNKPVSTAAASDSKSHVSSPPLSPLAATLAGLPPEFDESIYRSLHPDLVQFSDSGLRDHYRRHGRSEGRRSHALADRRSFVGLLSPELEVLEIGPQHAPLLRGPGVHYFDIYDRETLVAQAVGRGYPTEAIPHIDYVSPDADLGSVDRQFDAVLSSHVVEHQPDFVGHLDAVRRLLRPGGLYFALIPDKNYCFDHFMPATNIADLLDAHIEKRTRHSLRSQLAYAALRTHNDSRRHWRGDHDVQVPSAATIARTVDEHVRRDGRYEDVHAWYFEPTTFRQSLELLHELGESSFKVLRLYPTQTNTNEFWAILEAVV